MIIWPVEFLNLVRDLTGRHGTLLIADEVFTGFGRTGKMFACEHGPVTPDLMCLSKALTGGYLPLAATLVTEPLYQAFLSEDRGRGFLHGHSYTANPLGCAVALKACCCSIRKGDWSGWPDWSNSSPSVWRASAGCRAWQRFEASERWQWWNWKPRGRQATSTLDHPG